MKINVLAIIGLVLIAAFVILGYVWSFEQAWIVQLVGASAGLALIVGSGVDKKEPVDKWKGYLIGFGVSIGTILAVIGGIQESIITTIIGAVLLVAGAVVGIIMGQRE